MMPLARPCLGDLEGKYVRDAVESGWLSGTGPYVERFEQSLADRTGRAHVIAVSSGTTALELALAGLGIGPGDEVIVPALTFAAPAAATLTVGATPVLCDVSTKDWTLDPDDVAAAITERTRAIIAVDILGHPADFATLARFGVPVIEDAAQAHGAMLDERPAGSLGVVSVFSFFANKAITTGEGGCVTTDDPELAARIRLIANHGMTTDEPYVHRVAGRNARMTNVTAAIGLAQVQRWTELVDGRQRVSDRYRVAAPGIGTRPVRPGVTPACWLHTAVVGRELRDRVVATGRAAGIDVRAIWPALPTLPLYQGHTPRPCPVAEEVSASCLWLPTWSDLTDAEIDEVVEKVLRPYEDQRPMARSTDAT
jgi:perosamine synthetase